VQTPSAKLEKHDSLVVVLDTVAILSGICEQLPLRSLPDGSRPDVLRLDRQRNILFIGDAKNSETSGNRATQLRLRTYLSWVAAFLWRGGCGVFSLCFEHGTLATGWVDTALMLTNELSMSPPDLDVSFFPPNLTLVRFVWMTPRCKGANSFRYRTLVHKRDRARPWRTKSHSIV
jgi:hypothetical protein